MIYDGCRNFIDIENACMFDDWRAFSRVRRLELLSSSLSGIANGICLWLPMCRCVTLGNHALESLENAARSLEASIARQILTGMFRNKAFQIVDRGWPQSQCLTDSRLLRRLEFDACVLQKFRQFLCRQRSSLIAFPNIPHDLV